MKKIPLTRGLFALVDDEDFEFLSQFKWKANKTKPERTFYAARSLKREVNKPRKMLYLHRLIMNTPRELSVDHIDGNGLNNQKSNLRNISQAANSLNRTRLSSTNKSGFTGVYWSKQKNKWHALVAFRTKSKHLGFFDDVHEAAIAVKTFKDEYLSIVL